MTSDRLPSTRGCERQALEKPTSDSDEVQEHRRFK